METGISKESEMRVKLALFAAAAMTASAALADSQSSNTSSNSPSNNGVVRERVVDSYCENGYCRRTVERRVYRDDRRNRWVSERGHRRYRDLYYRDGRGDDDDD